MSEKHDNHDNHDNHGDPLGHGNHAFTKHNYYILTYPLSMVAMVVMVVMVVTQRRDPE